MAGAQGPSSFEIQTHMNAGGENTGGFQGFMHYVVMMKGAEKAAIFKVLGDEQNVMSGFASFGARSVGEMLFGATGANSSNPIRAIFTSIWKKDDLWAFAMGGVGGSNNVIGPGEGGGHNPFAGNDGAFGGGGSGGGGGDGGNWGGGSNHAFPSIGAATLGLSGAQMSDVHMSRLGGLAPDPSPGMGASIEMGR